MKAAVLYDFNDIRIEELTLPNLEVGQVLVRVQAATICGAQINEVTGAKGPDPYMPHLLGHEGCGVVAGVGPGVTCVKPGQQVVMHWRKGRGIEAAAPKYFKDCPVTEGQRYPGKTVVGAGPVATFAEYAVVSENRLTPVSGIDPIPASLLGCAVTTGLGLINNEAKLKIGQSIAVAGVGGVGLNVIQGAAMVSANPIIALDTVEKKLGQAKLYGATDAVVAPSDTLVEQVRGVCRNGVDVFVDCTGAPAMIDQGMRMLAAGGKMILVGQPQAGKGIFFLNARQHYCGKTILDSQGGLTDPNVDIPRYVELYKRGKLFLDSLVTDEFPLDDILLAFNKVISGEAGRVALVMNGNYVGGYVEHTGFAKI